MDEFAYKKKGLHAIDEYDIWNADLPFMDFEGKSE